MSSNISTQIEPEPSILGCEEPLSSDDNAREALLAGTPLPPAVYGDKTSLSDASKQIVKKLSVRAPRQFQLQLVTTWISVFLCISLAMHFKSGWLTALTICFVATRQNVLGLLMHEQSHRLAYSTKLGDLFCNLFVAYPLLVTLEGYRRVHLAHHQNYFSERDPDFIRKQGQEWTFPKRVASFVLLILKDLCGLSAIQTIRSKGMAEKGIPKQRSILERLVRPVYYVGFGVLFWVTGAWTAVLVYWLLPLLTVLQLIVRWGAICEHKYDLHNPSVVESTPIIIPRWWESLLLPNLNFTYHIYHHWFPRVPFCHLTKVHDIFTRDGLVQSDNVFNGYLSYLRSLIRHS